MLGLGVTSVGRGGRGGAKKAKKQFVAIGHTTTPTITVYPFDDSTGFGTKLADPSTLPGGSLCQGVAFSPSGDVIAVCSLNSPYILVYPWTESGFGSKYTDPATLPTGSGRGVAFSPSGDTIVVGHDATPFISAYPWSFSTGFGTKYANPSVAFSTRTTSLNFSPDGTVIAGIHSSNNTPFAIAWSAGFGGMYTISLGNSHNQFRFSPSGAYIARVRDTTGLGLYVYNWSGAGIGTVLSNPASYVSTDYNGVCFSKNEDYIVATVASSSSMIAWRWSGSGFGTILSAPASPVTTGRKCEFSPSGNAIFSAVGSSPYIQAYKWAGGFGTKYSSPATLPAGQGQAIATTEI